MRKIVLTMVTGLTLFACAAAEPVRVIFDTDMLTDFDDVGALASLHALADAGECEILATLSCTRGNASVAAIEVINGYYGRSDIPVGCAKEIGVIGEVGKTNGVKKTAAEIAEIMRKGNSGADMGWEEGGHYKYRKLAADYPQWVRHPDSDDAPDANLVYRRALAASPDHSVVICSIGFLTNLRRLLETKGDDISPLDGKALVAKKVRKWVAMACAYPHGKEYNSMMDPESSRIALSQWPTLVVISDYQLGMDIFAGRAIAEMPGGRNPVKDVFAGNIPSRSAVADNSYHMMMRCFGVGGRSAWDETAVLAAVRGEDAYFNVHRGEYRMVGTVGDDEWAPDEANGRHVRLTEKLNKVEVGKIIDELICRPPRRLNAAAVGQTKGISVFNLDSTNFTATHPDEDMTAAGVRAFLDSIIGQGAFTHFFICPAAQTALFDSKVLGPSWWRFTSGDANVEKAFLSDENKCPRRDRLLATNGVDVVQIYIDGCREKGVSPWFSMRMNDGHCPENLNWWGHSKLWVDHPEFRQGGGLSYAHEAVREHHLAFVRELLERYDVDGFECDWMRFPLPQRPEDLTSVMRGVRALVDAAAKRRGHPILLGVRVASRPNRAKEFGTDVAAWTKEGLVDWVSPCNFFMSVDFEMPVAAWKELVAVSPRRVLVVPGADSGVAANDLTTGKPVWRRMMTLAEYREWADRMHRGGADGLYLFNLFTFLEEPYHVTSLEPWDVIRKEGLSPAAIAGKEKSFPAGWKYEP